MSKIGLVSYPRQNHMSHINISTENHSSMSSFNPLIEFKSIKSIMQYPYKDTELSRNGLIKSKMDMNSSRQQQQTYRTNFTYRPKKPFTTHRNRHEKYKSNDYKNDFSINEYLNQRMFKTGQKKLYRSGSLV